MIKSIDKLTQISLEILDTYDEFRWANLPSPPSCRTIWRSITTRRNTPAQTKVIGRMILTRHIPIMETQRQTFSADSFLSAACPSVGLRRKGP